jgi:hypothetical protein
VHFRPWRCRRQGRGRLDSAESKGTRGIKARVHEMPRSILKASSLWSRRSLPSHRQSSRTLHSVWRVYLRAIQPLHDAYRGSDDTSNVHHLRQPLLSSLVLRLPSERGIAKTAWAPCQVDPSQGVVSTSDGRISVRVWQLKSYSSPGVICSRSWYVSVGMYAIENEYISLISCLSSNGA